MLSKSTKFDNSKSNLSALRSWGSKVIKLFGLLFGFHERNTIQLAKFSNRQRFVLSLSKEKTIDKKINWEKNSGTK